MSRGVKDLRELICVSRLTIRASDEEYTSSDDDDGSVGGSSSRLSSASSRVVVDGGDTSPDSGISTTTPTSRHSPEPPACRRPPPFLKPIDDSTSNVPRSAAARKRRRRRKKSSAAADCDHLGLYDLATAAQPLSPTPDGHGGGGGDGHGYDGHFDSLLAYMDPVVVAEWLVQANARLGEMARWCRHADNFVRFAHFWLAEFGDGQRAEIFQLEHGIVVDSLLVAFAAGRRAGAVSRHDLLRFLVAVFREYPGRLLSSAGPRLFLDHLDVLTSEREAAYRRLLTDVRCSTRVAQYAQWTLALRSFALVSMWFAVVDFYRKLQADTSPASPALAARASKTAVNTARLQQAIRCGFVDVVDYCLVSGKVSPLFEDDHKRTLVFMAVTHDQPLLLKYLLNQASPCPDVNRPADTGNTPLHAAANCGNAALVRLLLGQPSIVLDPTNGDCDDATPLHLAVLHGYREVVKLLLDAGADCTAKMGDLSVTDIARDFERTDIELLLAKTMNGDTNVC